MISVTPILSPMLKNRTGYAKFFPCIGLWVNTPVALKEDYRINNKYIEYFYY